MAASLPYLRIVGTAALQAGMSGIWVAVRDLSPARRRLARAGTVAALTAVSFVMTPDETSADDIDEIELSAQPFPVSDPPPAAEEGFTVGKKEAALLAGVAALSIAAIVGRHQLEKRWLARLRRNNHANPTRALAVRMAGLDFAGTLAIQLAERHKGSLIGR
ncbi:hypothetical protein [Actinoplanes sp. G11-F43]|uniref:hypothetical protein n=1 Tax=Actinoplanes sp. G11-F43 TaxID=3424130 RepID=UPI003D349142